MVRDRIDRMYEAVRKVNQAYEVWASRHGLTLYELQIYYEMIKNEDASMTQKDLCRKLDAPKTSINSIIKKQLQTEYIEMHVNPHNKREKILSLTPEGERFAKSLVERLFRYEEEAADTIAADEMEAAIRIQNQFAKDLLEKVEEKDE